jgi:adenosylcobinamide-phosphate synthase
MPPLGIVLAFLMDLAIGDPRGAPHPVKFIGKAASWLERLLMPASRGPATKIALGGLLAASVVIAVFAASSCIIHFVTRSYGWIPGMALQVLFAYTTISAKGLADAARDVMTPLAGGDLEAARRAVAMYVGRDTASLDEAGVARAAVETVSENTSDGVVAPLFYMAIGGAPLALAYKAVNTLDSMFGYKNERYTHFGYVPARLDDLANLVPARLTALLMVSAAWLLSLFSAKRFSAGGAWRIMARDRKNHTSPNSGYPESAAAGALGVRLGGESSYFGIKVVKPFIGDPAGPLSADKIKDSVRLMYATAVLAVIMAAIISTFLYRPLTL